MEIVRKLEMIVGGRWHGISFIENKEDIPQDVDCRQVKSFCEAIELAAVYKMVINPDQFTCPGACYAFGGSEEMKKTMIDRIVEEKDYSEEYALQLIDDIPHFKKMPKMIGINCLDKPDVVLSQLQPEQVMRLLQLYQGKIGATFQSEMSSVTSACGNTAVRAYEKQDLSISFGCDETRKNGSLTRDRLYVGLPYNLVERLTQK